MATASVLHRNQLRAGNDPAQYRQAGSPAGISTSEIIEIMKKLIISALCAVAFGACGGGGDDDGDISITDSGPVIDGAPPIVTCNPVTQAGCEADEKCAQLVESAPTEANPDAPFLARTDCVPNGTVPEGGACTRGEPGATSGFDDCVGSYSCISGACSPICNVGPPDSCRVDGQSAAEGSYCTLFNELFDDVDLTGICVPGCNPVNDTLGDDGIITNNDCEAAEGCYLNASRGIAACTNVAGGSEENAQNTVCAASDGQCYLNACASGFLPLLPDSPDNGIDSTCARYCTPVDTHTNSAADSDGLDSKCSGVNLGLSGGTNGNPNPHQCRFIQNFYSDTGAVPVEVGMCVPTISVAGDGGSWADCTVYDHDGLVAAYNAETTPDGQTTAFNNFCLETPADPANSEITPECLGFFRGCISLEKEAELVDVGGAIFNKEAWAGRHGVDITTIPAVVADQF